MNFIIIIITIFNRYIDDNYYYDNITVIINNENLKSFHFLCLSFVYIFVVVFLFLIFYPWRR